MAFGRTVERVNDLDQSISEVGADPRLMWRIEFESAKFLPFLPEESQANPGVYGFELAAWLSEALARRNVITTYPFGEDWGWLLDYVEDNVGFNIGCSSVSSEEEGYQGTPLTWSIFVDSRKSMKQRLAGVDVGGRLQALSAQITAVLKSEGITWREV